MQETWVQSLGQDDPLEKEMATHSSILAWENPWATVYGAAKQSDTIKRLNNNNQYHAGNSKYRLL